MQLNFEKGFYDAVVAPSNVITTLNELIKKPIFNPKFITHWYDTFKTKTIKIEVSENKLNNFKTDSFDEKSLTEHLVNEIVIPVVNSYLIKTSFMRTFYKEYVSKYIDNIVESSKRRNSNDVIDYSLILTPFESGWINFCNTGYSKEVIDELTIDIMYTMTKYKVIFNEKETNKRVKCTLYDMLMRPTMVTQALFSKYKYLTRVYRDCNVDSNHHSALRFHYPYTDLNKMDRYVSDFIYTNADFDNNFSIIPIDFIKSIVRYIFVTELKEYIPIYLNELRKSNIGIESIISDIELFYTKNLSVLRGNFIYYNDRRNECDTIIKKAEYDQNGEKIIGDVLDRILSELAPSIDQSNKQLLNEIYTSKDVMTNTYPLESYKKLRDLINLKVNETKTALNNSYNFSFVKRWNEILQNQNIWNAEEYFHTINIFKSIKED